MQKNGVKGNSIGNGATGHPRACAVADIRRRVAHLRQHSALPIMQHTAVLKEISGQRSAVQKSPHDSVLQPQ